MTAALWLAIDDNAVSPGVLGFVVVAALGVATFLLIRSMNRQMRKIDFDEDAIDRERPTGRPDGAVQTEQPSAEPPTAEQPIPEQPSAERRDPDEG